MWDRVARFPMEKNRDPFLRRAGRVVDSLCTSASRSAKWNLSGTSRGISNSCWKLKVGSFTSRFLVFDRMAASGCRLALRSVMGRQGAPEVWGSLLPAWEERWQLGQYPHRDTISNLSDCLSLEALIALTHYLIRLSQKFSSYSCNQSQSNLIETGK